MPTLKMTYKRSSTKKYNPVEDYEDLTPEEKKICNKLTYVVRLARGNKKKIKELEESRLCDTKEIEDSILNHNDNEPDVITMSGFTNKERRLTM